MEGSANINIALVGDHALNLHALATLLVQPGDFQVVSISRNIRLLDRSISSSAKESYPHIVILDVNFELHPAMEIIAFVRKAHPEVSLAVLGLTRDAEAIGRLLQMGASGYIPKNTDARQLEETIRRIVREGGCTACVREQEPSSMQGAEGRGPDRPAFAAWPPVTETEHRYFRMAMSESSNEEIRRALRLCESSFVRLVGQLYRRFGVRSRDGLVLALFRNRLVVRDDL
jgi:DNA-binding NarL/FixJ family response regulator